MASREIKIENLTKITVSDGKEESVLFFSDSKVFEKKKFIISGEVPPDIRELLENLNKLSNEDIKQCVEITGPNFLTQVKADVDCCGCVAALSKYLEDNRLIKQCDEGVLINENQSIKLHESIISQPKIMIQILQMHSNKTEQIEQLINTICGKKSDNQRQKKYSAKKNTRCLLHSMKPLPNNIWKNNLMQLCDQLGEENEYCLIDESLFLFNLQNYLKKKKFCPTCKENISFSYQTLKETACQSEDEDQRCNNSENESVNSMHNHCYSIHNEEELQLKLEDMHLDDPQEKQAICNCQCDKEYVNNCECSCHQSMNENEEFINENLDLISCIKYCRESRKILIPYDYTIINAIVSKSSLGCPLPVYKHASTKEDAQEELLICLGMTVKDKLMNLWKNKQCDDVIRFMFLQKASEMILFQLKQMIEKKKEENGHKSAIEQFLLEEEKKKEKQKKKRQQKKNRKRQIKKEEENNKKSSTSSTRGSSDRVNKFIENEARTEGQRNTSQSLSSRERRLLTSLGWSEKSPSSPQVKQELDQLKQYHWQIISQKREEFRRKTREVWKTMISQKKTQVS